MKSQPWLFVNFVIGLQSGVESWVFPSTCPSWAVDRRATQPLLLKALASRSQRDSTKLSSVPLPYKKRPNPTSSQSNFQSPSKLDIDLEAFDCTVHAADSDMSLNNNSTATPPTIPQPSSLSTAAATITHGVALVLNVNAKGVSDPVVQLVQDLASQHNDPEMRVYVTNTAEEARQVAKTLVRDPPTILIPMGGDGTLTTLIQYLADAQQERCNVNNTNSSSSSKLYFPKIAYLPMGTGNALELVIGCKTQQRPSNSRVANLCRRILCRQQYKFALLQQTLLDLLQVAQQMEQQQQQLHVLPHCSDELDGVDVDIVELPLLNVTTARICTHNNKDDDEEDNNLQQQSHLCFFAGVGFDSLMLQDYEDLQQATKHSSFWKDKLSSVMGYCVALVSRTLPKCVNDQAHMVQVQISTSRPQSTYWMDHRRGDVLRSVNPNADDKNTVLYQGPAGIVAAATVPYYGGGLRLFPFARTSPDAMQLRVGRIPPMVGMRNLPGIFGGYYRDSSTDGFGCLDFLSCSFSLELQEAFPVQQSGESVGASIRVDVELVNEPRIEFVTLLPHRPLKYS